ncbi:MAG: glycine betaine/proline transport system permease protein [Clostridia bacterium]|nr:glycine betaine/proline transport system permease protein [Clostridia bacterium]
MSYRLPLGSAFEWVFNWLDDNADWIFEAIKVFIKSSISTLEDGLLLFPAPIMIVILVLIAWKLANRRIAAFALVSFMLILSMGLWEETMMTFALILIATLISLIIGIPLGIWSARSERMEAFLRPILDFMQTMPAFVYLIPAVMFFGMGRVSGIVATVIFAMPPAIRLTSLGIRQVPAEVVEAARAFGSTPNQILFKIQLPMALPTIMAGVNQCIMLSLSMVVIASMIGSGGLGGEVLRGITQFKIGLGFESGLAVVLLAIFLDRVTQYLGASKKLRNNGGV